MEGPLDFPYNTQYPLGNVVPVSTPGSPPVGHWVAIMQSAFGDWWLTYNGTFLGYVSANHFTMLNTRGCHAQWYLEVLDRKAGTAWVETQMGTGKFGDTAAPGEAAWVQQPLYWDTNYVPLEPTIDQGMGPVKNECYKRSPLMDLGPGLGKIFFAGGPGGYNPLCTK